MIKKFNVYKTRQLDKINKLLSIFYRKPICKITTELSNVRNILVIDFALMGDMVMNIPFLKTIKRNCPKAQITMVGMSWARKILEDQGLVDKFIIFDGKNKLSSPLSAIRNMREIKDILKEINQTKYDIGFESKGDLRHTLFFHYTLCNRSITYNYTGGDYLVTDSFIPKEETKHLIDEKLDLLQMSGFKIFEEDRVPQLILSKAGQQLVKQFLDQNNLKDKRIIGIHPGASNLNKQFKFFPEVIKNISKLLQEKDVFCVFEGPDEKDIVDRVCLQLEKGSIEYLRVKREIKEYVELVSICNYMICNDSAAGHIAASYGIPVLVIFGPIRPETALPRGAGIIEYVSHELNCKPCTLPDCPLGTAECIQGITSVEVEAAIRKLLVKENKSSCGDV